MNFSNIDEYLKGTIFSNGLLIDIAKKESSIIYRINYLKDLAKSKKIVHVGCVDHIPLITGKIDKNTWLHKHLVEDSTFCVGIDTNSLGIEYLKQLGFNNLYCFDIINDAIPSEISNTHFDTIILGEIIEHVDNPVQFLSKLHEKFSLIADNIIITTPNAFSFKNFKWVFKHKEHINSDHRYWFSPYTLSKICTLAGFKPESIQIVHHQKLSRFALIQKTLLRFFPALRSTIVIVLKF